jgi:alpha-tubulin suppressor-like RCC1 family protein
MLASKQTQVQTNIATGLRHLVMFRKKGSWFASGNVQKEGQQVSCTINQPNLLRHRE